MNTPVTVVSQISVDGVPRNNWGVWADLPVGSHQVCFGAVSGSTAPACQDPVISAGNTTTIVGTYT